MKILLTGASGSVGRELIRQNPDIVPISIRPDDLGQLSALSDKDLIIHAAAITDHDVNLPDLIRSNVELSARLLEIAHHGYIDVRVILISSMSFLSAPESIKAIPDMSNYAYSKYLMENLIYRFPNTIAVRFSTLFCRDPEKDGLSRIIHTAKHQGKVSISECSRDFIPLNTACSSLLELCNKDISFFRPRSINIASGKSTQLSDVAKHLNAKYGTGVLFNKEMGSKVCDTFGSVARYGLTPFQVNLYKEIEDYYTNA